MKILVTAFDPFDGQSVNPAQQAVEALPAVIAGAEVVTQVVPTVFGESIRVAVEAIERHRPDAVLCVGQAGGRPGLTVERVAINVDDARIPDNAGGQPVDVPVVPGGPDAYFATLPIKAMVQSVRDAGLPASVSNTAGTFVCNHLMYGVLHHLSTHGPSGARGGFAHVPFVPEQVADQQQPSMSRVDITASLVSAIEAIVTHSSDILLGDGATH